MLRFYTLNQGMIEEKTYDPGMTEIPAGTVWIDLLEPLEGETLFLEDLLEVDIPTREETQKIEKSARLYEENQNIILTTTLVIKADTDEPGRSTVTFVITPKYLISLRYFDFKAFYIFLGKLGKHPAVYTGTSVLMFVGLLDTIIERLSKIIENLETGFDELSNRAFLGQQTDAENDNTKLKDLLSQIGRKGDLLTKVRDSLNGLSRLIVYANHTYEQRGSFEERYKFKSLMEDAQSLREHVHSLEMNISFLLDATLGMINIEQNNIIKVFTVASVMFMPPTLIASIYGMNFKIIPELEWIFGYPYALSLMLLSAVTTYIITKKRGWFD